MLLETAFKFVTDRLLIRKTGFIHRLAAITCAEASHQLFPSDFVFIPFNLYCSLLNVTLCILYTVALFHLKRALKSANPLILEQPLKRAIEDNLFLLFFLSGWTKNKWIRTF